MGITEISIVEIKPITPYVGVNVKLKITAIMVFRRLSFRFTSVLPWLLMRFPELRYPNAV